MKAGLVLEGGSYRGIFTAGVLDVMLEQNIEFSYVTGVSSGACNAVNYLAGQKGRTQKVILHENADPYFGVGQMAKSGKLLNLDVMLYDYSYEQIPLDFESFFANKANCEVGVANVETGECEYLSADSDDRLISICKATCSVPMMSKPVRLDGKEYMDGSTVNPIPFEKAAKICDKIVVVMTRREDEPPTDYSKMKSLLKVVYRHPRWVEAMCSRTNFYNSQTEKLLEMEKEGKAFIIRPSIPSIGHFENNADKINDFYHNGCEIMNDRMFELKAFLEV